MSEEKIKFEDWFDINDKEHIAAWRWLRDNGQWPKDFIPDNVELHEFSVKNLTYKMVNAWVHFVTYGEFLANDDTRYFP